MCSQQKRFRKNVIKPKFVQKTKQKKLKEFQLGRNREKKTAEKTSFFSLSTLTASEGVRKKKRCNFTSNKWKILKLNEVHEIKQGANETKIHWNLCVFIRMISCFFRFVMVLKGELYYGDISSIKMALNVPLFL